MGDRPRVRIPAPPPFSVEYPLLFSSDFGFQVVAFVHDFFTSLFDRSGLSLILGLYLDCAKAFQFCWIGWVSVSALFQFSDILPLLPDDAGVMQNDD